MLITGASGFSGRRLAHHYHLAGWQVVGTHAHPLPAPDFLPFVEWHRANLQDAESWVRVVAAARPDVVQHLAAQSSVSRSIADPRATFEVNILGQAAVLEAIRERGRETRVVIAGSSDEYGGASARGESISEDAQLLPMNPYALSKVAQDVMATQYHRLYGVQTVVARPFLQLGAGRSDTFAVGAFARQVAEIESGRIPPVVRVGSLDLRRDFIDVDDVCKALQALAERGRPGEAYNVGSGAGRMLREVLSTMIDLAGVAVEIREDESLLRPGEPAGMVADITKISVDTGWKPVVAFRDSVRATLDYWRAQVAKHEGVGRA